MNFNLFDNNVSTTMNVFLIIANIINLVYNLPQMYKTYKTKSTGDFSEWFLLLRVVGNVIWIPYSIQIQSMLMLINTLVTVLASIFIGYYKVKEIINSNKRKIYMEVSQDTNNTDNNYYNNSGYMNLDNNNTDKDSFLVSL
jgi:MtN3 and saliva related transmembrane protein